MLKRVARLTLGLLVAVTLAAFVSHLLGRSWLCESGWVPSRAQSFMLNFTSYAISTALSIGFITRKKIKEVVRPIAFVVINALAIYFMGRQGFICPVLSNAIIQYGIGAIVFIYLIIKSDNKRQICVDIVTWFAFGILFNVILVIIRRGNLYVLHVSQSPYSNMLDILIVSSILYITGGEGIESAIRKYYPNISALLYVDSCRGRRHRRHDRGREEQASQTNFQQLKAYYKHYSWRTWGFWKGILIILFQLSVLALALLVCHWFGFFREGILMMMAFYASTRVVFKVWAHVKRPMVCALLTIFIVYHLAGGVARFDVSLFAAVLYGVGIGWVSHEIRLRIDKSKADAEYRKAKEAEDKLLSGFRLIRGCDYEQMRLLALRKGIDERHIECLRRKYCDWTSDYLKQALIHFTFEYKKYGLKYPPSAVSTVQGWCTKAEMLFSQTTTTTTT